MVIIDKITAEGIPGLHRSATTYRVLNPQVYGIDNWESFRDSLFPSNDRLTSQEDQSKMVQTALAFKGYESSDRTAVGDGEPRYGITYLQDVKADPDLSLARKVIQAAKAGNVPLIMFFGPKYTDRAYPSNECLPFFGLRFDHVPEGLNEAAAVDAFEQFMSSEFPGLSVYRNGKFLGVSTVGYYGGRTFNVYEHRGETPPVVAYNGFAKNSVW